jgi:glycosyltransferase involved in cell wall biosynthesis
LQENGFQWMSFPLSRQGTNPFSELQTLSRLMRIYRKFKPDIVHHFTIKPVIYGSLAARLLGINNIINSITGLGHLFIDTQLVTRLIRNFAKILYRVSLHQTQIIFENPEDRDTFIQNHLLKLKQTHLILGTGVNVEKFRPSKKENNIPLVLFSSRLLSTKGLLEFVEAAQRLKQKGLKAHFAIAGTPDPGNPASISQEQIDAWKLEGTVDVWGWQNDMPDTLAKTDIFCLPSYREGVPSALLEACASGLPIVTTDVPGCRDVVKNNLNGLLVPPRDSQALANALEKLLVDKDLRGNMGDIGRQYAVEKFSLDKIIKQTLTIYQKALEVKE